MFVASPVSSQDSTDGQEGSAAGRTAVPATKGSILGRNGATAEAAPASLVRAHPRGYTQQGIAAKNLAENGLVEQTTKTTATVMKGLRRPNLPQADAATTADAPVLGISFPGTADTGQTPPDPTIAVGPNNIVVAVNTLVNIFDKSGNLLASQNLADFFAKLGPPAADDTFDPWLVFDPYINRFWLIAASCTDDPKGNCDSRGSDGSSTILVALSNGSDPTVPWMLFALDARLRGSTNTGGWCDYPKIGIDAQAVYFTCNMFTSGKNPDFVYAKVRIMTKDQFINDTCCLWWDRWGFSEGFLNLSKSFSLQPALMHGATVEDGMFLINAVGNGGGGDELKVRRVRNAQRCCIPGNQKSPDFQEKSQSVGSYSAPPDALQLGTKTKIATGDTRLLYAFWQDGLLSTGQNTGRTIAFTELDVSNYTTIRVVNDFVEKSNGLSRYYPHVAVNAEGDKTMVFSASNNTQFVDVRYIGIPSSSICKKCLDGPDTIIQSGQGSYGTDKVASWGDYSGASADPDGIGIWIHGEFAAKNNKWGTQVALTREAVARLAADLVPEKTRPSFCNISSQGLVITVSNRGGSAALPSLTRVDFANGGGFSLPTPSILPNNSVDLSPIRIPSSCFSPDCNFSITVDATNLVDELDESNNTADGLCIG
jgi:hypothetical protein